MVPRFFVPFAIKAANGHLWRPGLLCKANVYRFANYCSALHNEQQTVGFFFLGRCRFGKSTYT